MPSAVPPRRSPSSILKQLAAIGILITAVCYPVSGQTNDNFVNRTVMGFAGGTVFGNNLNATKQTGEPNHAGDGGGKSVWWSWTPTASGLAAISTTGSSFDTVLGIYTGTSVGALTQSASDDDGGEGPTSLVRLSVTAGTAYQIAVDGYGGTSGSIILTVIPPGTTNDRTIALTVSPSNGGVVNGAGIYEASSLRTVSATPSSGYTFTNWTENGGVVSCSMNYSFTMNANRTLVANFTDNTIGQDTYEIKNIDLIRGELTFREVSGALFYRVEWSKTLAPGSWSSGAPGVPRIEVVGAGDRTVKIEIIQPPCYYRVVAEMAPPIPQGFALIPSGSFTMGDSFSEGHGDERPLRQVTVRAFYMAKYETTKALWDEVRAWGFSRGYTDLAVGSGKASNHPVVNVHWWDVIKWCNARSEKDGLEPCYRVGGNIMRTGTTEPTANWAANGYRLPTEAEWEKAARSGLNWKRFPWGDTITHSQANYVSNSSYAYDILPTSGYHPTYEVGGFPYTSPVGSFVANCYGLHDMAGNASEWCWDWYGIYALGEQIDPKGSAAGSYRVIRGGAWFFYADFCRVSFRNGLVPSDSDYYNDLGFRLARGQ